MPRYSLIIPVYNSAILLPRLFSQFKKITYADLEYIFVNDGSSDDSQSLLEEFALQVNNVRIVTQENAGAGMARNAGLSAADGKYVWFVDSDDLVNPDAFFEFDRILSERPETQILFVSYEFFRDYDSFHFPDMKSASFSTPKKRNIMIHSDTAPWTRIYLRSFMSENGFSFPKSSFAEDTVTSIHMCCEADHIVKSEFISYGYYVNPESISNKKPGRYFEDMLVSMEKIHSFIKVYPEYSEEIEYLLDHHVKNCRRFFNPKSDAYKRLNAFLDDVDFSNNIYGKIMLSYENTLWWRLGKLIRMILYVIRMIFKY